ncbi:flagella synthesis protein FlgN [Thiohalobacter sp.]|uniref:flagella synthesis protein FlgN n=1 Tax=Thiohalobacter sp. TaxID=2025948 RepID=UPI00262EDD30|nr:flagellar protein FlgN [Thiohalobacter sp.]
MGRTPYQQTEALLDAHEAAVDRLAEALEQEIEVLAERDLARMADVAQRKLACFAELEQLDGTRRALLDRARQPDTAAGMQALLAAVDRSGRLRERWRALLLRLEDCQRLNRANGAHVELSRRHVEDALAILRGRQPGTLTYGERGERTPAPGTVGRNLGSA